MNSVFLFIQERKALISTCRRAQTRGFLLRVWPSNLKHELCKSNVNNKIGFMVFAKIMSHANSVNYVNCNCGLINKNEMFNE